jgi:multidrug efflux pump subunit AcrA (membrane-fusion protein)
MEFSTGGATNANTLPTNAVNPTPNNTKPTKIDSLAYYRTNLQQTQTELQTAQQTLQQTQKSLQENTENATQATKIAEQASDIATKTQQIKDLEAKIASLETQLEKTERELEREKMNLFAGFKNFSFYEKPEQEEPEENIPRAKNIQAIEFQYYFSRELTKDDIVVLKIGEYATIPLDEQSLRTLNYNRLRHKFVKGTFQVEKDKPTEIEVRILHTNAKYDIKDQEVGKMLLRFYR